MIGIGFPNRPRRDAFGPDPVNRYPVRDPAQELDGEVVGRAMFWQLSGLGLMSPIAWVHGGFLDPTPVVHAWEAAFDPRKEAADPVITRTGAGLYMIEFAEQYPNEAGELVTLDVARWGFGWFVPPGSTPGAGQVVVATAKLAPNKVNVSISSWDGAAYSPEDGDEALIWIF